ncbi:V-type proton ATPase subunit S1 [Microcaecilia unicolor]|uniref:V-type proton ATPase subunit S1-like n=1 Tax=Microcaecilia unicolor TaxID=1415580 RepID=A0A6P7YXW5_9AMPH|nr:V-type proton ATPase subunit S1-like [Microcaecilia unicolor]
MQAYRDILVPLICTFSVLFRGVFPRDHVPALLWSTHGSLWDSKPAVHEGHVISGNELHTLLQPVFTQNSKNLVLFLQDQLSVEDFTYYSKVHEDEKPFHSVQEICRFSPSSLVLPAVDWKATSHLFDYLQKKADWHLVNMSDCDASELVMEPSKPNLILVKLQSFSRTNDFSAVKAFVEIDKQIGKLTKTLLNRGITFSAIYTAMRPSRVPVHTAVVSQAGRRLMETDEQPPTVPDRPFNWTSGNETCILMYATTFTLKIGELAFNLANKTFISQEVDASSSYCSDTNTTLSLKYTNLQNINKSLEVRFLLTNQFYLGSARNWSTLDFVQIFQDDVLVTTFRVYTASAPAEYSFHCQLVGTSEQNGSRLVYDEKGSSQKWDILMTDFQIQGFNIKDNQFSYASDCASFFSPGIWMGLVTSLVLLWILCYGIFMIMRLSTNDRFDDPKSQPLSVPLTE